MRVAIVVPGRFHAFQLASALVRRGHEVTVFTNFPASIVRRWDLSPRNVQGFPLHGVAVRVAERSRRLVRLGSSGKLALPIFARWALRQLRKGDWDVVQSYSGASLELLTSELPSRTLMVVRRSSAHIAEQRRILDEEVARTGIDIERPENWIVEREMREYDLADAVFVPSNFARETFIWRGFPPSRVQLLPMSADTRLFRCSRQNLESRQRRIIAGDPLRVLYVGALSARKGMWDIAEVLRAVEEHRFHFTFVGRVTPEAKEIFAEFKDRSDLSFRGHRPETELPLWYKDADIFLFPTLEDGFAVTLAQALASGLPAITTTNCSGPDLVTQGETGWVLAPRSAAEITGILEWCDGNRPELAEMSARVASSARRSLSWDDIAAEFEAAVGRARSHKLLSGQRREA